MATQQSLTRPRSTPPADEISVSDGTHLPGRQNPVDIETRTIAADDRTFYLAHRRPDGTYSLTLTEEGVQRFETSLAIADDLGRNSRISPRSTIADIMDRTSTREELSELLRLEQSGFLPALHVLVLRRKLRGSERVTQIQSLISHIAKIAIVGVLAIWAIMQFLTSIQDIQDIPGILANIPNDLINLHPTSAFGDVGNRISDAGLHVLYGVAGICLAYVAAFLIHPLAAIYRKDQLIPAERLVLRLTHWSLHRANHDTRA